MDRLHSNRIWAVALGSLMAVLMLAGCVRQDAWLSYTVPETPLPTATAVLTPAPTRDPIPLDVESVQGAEFHTDRKGIPILDKETHYFTYYLAFSELRIY